MSHWSVPQAAKALKPGDAFKNEPGVHNARNTGTKPVKILAIYLVEKGKPLGTPVVGGVDRVVGA